MNVLRILILCIAAAFVCASLRMGHPQIASAVALAAGIVALNLSLEDIKGISNAVTRLEAFANQGDGTRQELLKICGIALVAEFASDICRDSGEVALAHRIDVGVKLGILAAALPAAIQIMEKISQLLP